MATGQHHIIKETTDTLVELLTDTFKEAGYKRVHVIVEAPKPEAIEGKLPAVCVYLYQVSPDYEGVAMRGPTDVLRERLPSGKIVEYERKAPLFARLDYVVSTWAQTPEDEQLLTGLAIRVLSDVGAVEGEKLKGQTFPEGYALPVILNSKMDEGVQARFWGSLNQPIRPALAVWTVVPILSDVLTAFKRVEERVIAYKRLGEKGGEIEIGPEGRADVPPPGTFIKRTK